MMTNAAETFEQQLNDAIADFEQRVECTGEDEQAQAGALDDAVRRYPGCEQGLREYEAVRQYLKPYSGPLLELATASNAPPRIDGYTELVEVGRGGMGVVFRATQQSTGRSVAIKVIRPERLALLDQRQREEIIARFRIEPIATMDHPNIVRVYHAGHVNANRFLVMELVDGKTLREIVGSGDCTIADVVIYIEQAARGLHHAHQCGVLHRDIKPANIMVDRSHRSAKVVDFGLARLDQSGVIDRVDGDSSESGVMGTLPYMSPEQLRDSDEITVAADIYGLGATLYESLTGQPPFQGARAEVRQAIRTEQPRPVRELHPAVPRSLERICLKCLSKDPSERFDSAKQVADELERLRDISDGNAAIQFAKMGWPLLFFGLVCLTVHSGVFLLQRWGVNEAWLWATFFAGYVPLFVIFAMTRMPTPMSVRGARRELWSIWLGHALLAAVSFLSLRIVTGDVDLTLRAGYPVFAAGTAMALLIMSANFWRFHAVLACFWVGVAAAMLVMPGWSPVLFAVAAAATSLVIGGYALHLMRERWMDQAIAVNPQRSGPAYSDVSLLARSQTFGPKTWQERH